MKRLAIVSIVALTLATSAAAQSPAPSERTPATVFRSGASLVALNVTVTDGKRLVPGLRPDDFAVYEDGVLQRVQFFEARQVPIDLILLLDTSSSMSDKMPVVHEAAVGFLKSMCEVDRGAVVTFGNNVNILQRLTSNRAALEQAIRPAAARGSTALNNALYVAMKDSGDAPIEVDVELTAVLHWFAVQRKHLVARAKPSPGTKASSTPRKMTLRSSRATSPRACPHTFCLRRRTTRSRTPSTQTRRSGRFRGD